MNRTWSKPLPLEMVCPDCAAVLRRGIQFHGCAITAPDTPIAPQRPHRLTVGDLVLCHGVPRRVTGLRYGVRQHVAQSLPWSWKGIDDLKRNAHAQVDGGEWVHVQHISRVAA